MPRPWRRHRRSVASVPTHSKPLLRLGVRWRLRRRRPTWFESLRSTTPRPDYPPHRSWSSLGRLRLEVTDRLMGETSLAGYHLMAAVRGDLLARLDRFKRSESRTRACRITHAKCAGTGASARTSAFMRSTGKTGEIAPEYFLRFSAISAPSSSYNCECPPMGGQRPHGESALRTSDQRPTSLASRRGGRRAARNRKEWGGKKGQPPSFPSFDGHPHAAQSRGPSPHPGDPGAHEPSKHSDLHAFGYRGPQKRHEARSSSRKAQIAGCRRTSSGSRIA
jgi:hypothetical protein